MPQIPWLPLDDLTFPPAFTALSDPNGLLAAGGDLRPERILEAYRHGIFPWFNPGDPILWWSPNPRTVIYPEQLHISRSLRKTLKRHEYQVTFDHAFEQTMRECAAPRNYEGGTWITDDIIDAYTQLHYQGYAHSVEVWQQEENSTKKTLVGGLYGIALGKVFFGESMFSRADNASKVGFAHLVHFLNCWAFTIIDCQVANDHLFSLGATEIAREDFQQTLRQLTTQTANTPKAPNWINVDTYLPW